MGGDCYAKSLFSLFVIDKPFPAHIYMQALSVSRLLCEALHFFEIFYLFLSWFCFILTQQFLLDR